MNAATMLAGLWRRRALASLLGAAAACAAPGALAADTLHGQYDIELSRFAPYARWDLLGVRGQRRIAFGLRADELVNTARLDLRYRYSGELLPELSHLNVLLNGEVLQTLPLPQDAAEPVGRAMVDLPPAYLKPYNQLELQLIGHYTLACEDPLHPALWADIDPDSRLMLDVRRKVLPDDLAQLPGPLFDPRDVRSPMIPVMLGEPSARRLEAAGIAASWLGAAASYRGAAFDAVGQLPEQGHAIVLVRAGESLPGVSMPPLHGPTVAMRANPHDPAGKLLLIAGRNEDEIRSAAVALALASETLAGPEAAVSALDVLPRKPYDAPNWLPRDRPVALSELLPAEAFTVAGREPGPITIGLRLPPDLSDWKTKVVPLNLRHRHSATRADEGGTLDILLNRQRIQRLELASREESVRDWVQGDGTARFREVLLPLFQLQSQAMLQFQFLYPPVPHEACRGSFVDTRRSAIDPTSTIDISGLPHQKSMPDLAAFGSAGFPFTRMADLSETVVVLPPAAGNATYSAFLDLMGHMGRVTGYPAIGLTVANDTDASSGKDLLVLDDGSGSGILGAWAAHLPQPELARLAAERGGGLSGWFQGVSDWFGIGSSQRRAGSLATPPAGGAYVAGLESPVTSGRSAIVLAGASGAGLLDAVKLMLPDAQHANVMRGSLLTIQDGSVQVLSQAKTYTVGTLGPYQTAAWFLSRYPFILLPLYLLGAVLIAVLLYRSLRLRAERRLMGGAGPSETPR